MAKSKPKNWIVGRWLIESMEQWDRDFIDEEVRGYFEFDTKGSGDFQFGFVHGQINYRLSERDGKPALEFTWDGNDEMAPAEGRGWGFPTFGNLEMDIEGHERGIFDPDFCEHRCPVCTRVRRRKCPLCEVKPSQEQIKAFRWNSGEHHRVAADRLMPHFHR